MRALVQLSPTRTAAHLALAAVVMIALGAIAQQAALVAWGGAMIFGLAVARAVTLLGVNTIRASGFEMLWQEPRRVVTVTRGQYTRLRAEVRNRDLRAARYKDLRVLASPYLEVQIEPTSAEVPASGRLKVEVSVKALRVGRHGIHGLALELQGGPGLFDVPLTFANPFGIDAGPSQAVTSRLLSRGALGQASNVETFSMNRAGDSWELRELREHQASDSLRRIAWKASARRGQLLVREYESVEHEMVWIVLDCACELWWGPLGNAPLDQSIDAVATIALGHLARQDAVGLSMVGSRALARLPARGGNAQKKRILQALSLRAQTYDFDRSALDDGEVAAFALEHMRPLDPDATRGISAKRLDQIADLAPNIVERAPFGPSTARGRTPQEKALRRYLERFGLYSAPRYDSDRSAVDGALARELQALAVLARRPSIVYVASPLLFVTEQSDVASALTLLRTRRAQVRWVQSQLDFGGLPDQGVLGNAVKEAITIRTGVAHAQAQTTLARLGVRAVTLDVRRRERPAVSSAHE